MDALESLTPSLGSPIMSASPEKCSRARSNLRLGLKPGSRAEKRVGGLVAAAHTQTNFIHIDTKVDFSRNVLLCQGERVEWHVAEG